MRVTPAGNTHAGDTCGCRQRVTPCRSPPPLHTREQHATQHTQPAVSFTPGKPFFPYEQLLAVQPASSCKLLPEPYQHLMTSPTVRLNTYFVSFYLRVDLRGSITCLP